MYESTINLFRRMVRAVAASTSQQRSVAGGVALGLVIAAVIQLFLTMFGVTAANLVGVVAAIAFLAMCGCLLVVLEEIASLRQAISRQKTDIADAASDNRNGRSRSTTARTGNTSSRTPPAAAQANSPNPDVALKDDTDTDEMWDDVAMDE